MGFSTFILTTILVVMTSAGWPGWPTGENPFSAYQPPMLTSLRFGPVSIPTPVVPKFPTIPSPAFLFPFPTMAGMQSIHEMVKQMPSKGGSYSGVVVSTQTESKMKQDGTVVKKGGSTIVINDDGKVTVKTTGDAPPDLGIRPKRTQQHPKKIDARFAEFKKPISPFNLKSMYDFEPLEKFDAFPDFPTLKHMKPINPEVIKTYVPGPGETFQGHVVSSHTYSSNVNGQKTQGGQTVTIDNNNGNIKEEKEIY